jgi:hypothetical protein
MDTESRADLYRGSETGSEKRDIIVQCTHRNGADLFKGSETGTE